jgi:hypothetical protein
MSEKELIKFLESKYLRTKGEIDYSKLNEKVNMVD